MKDTFYPPKQSRSKIVPDLAYHITITIPVSLIQLIFHLTTRGNQ